MDLRLGLLDFGERPGGVSAESYLATTLELAQLAECSGFHRYWLAEHQGYRDAWAHPEIIIARLASGTTRIRIGSAGVLFSIHDPLRIASDFTLLATLFPDRIDLGLARLRPAIESNVVRPEEVCASSDDFAAKLDVLLDLLHGTRTSDERYRDAIALPVTPNTPAVWLLGSSDVSSRLAAERGISYAHSLFHRSSRPAQAVIRDYRNSFVGDYLVRRTGRGASETSIASSFNAGPAGVAIALAGSCCETQAEAMEVRSSFRNAYLQPTLFGDPDTIYDAVTTLSSECGIVNFVFYEVAPEPQRRRRSIELLAQRFSLRKAVTA